MRIGMLLAVYGTGGTGRELVDQVRKDEKTKKKYEEIIFVDDLYQGEKIGTLRVFSFKKLIQMYEHEKVEFLICVGEPSLRKKLGAKIRSQGYRLGKWIHPQAEISPSAQIGEGTMITRCFIDSEVKIGENVIVSWESIIGHDTKINENCLVSPHVFIGGGCNIGNEVYIGAGAVVRDGIQIGDRSVIGLGAAVYKNVGTDMTAIGNPAKLIPRSGTSLF